MMNELTDNKRAYSRNGFLREPLRRALLIFGLAAILCAVGCDARLDPEVSESTPEVAAMEIYVSLTGNDGDPGTEDKPLRTLEGARDALRRASMAVGLTSPVTVWVRGGDYLLANSFVLDKQDSGTDAARITYQAYPGETVRLLGGHRLTPEQFAPISDDNVRRRLVDQNAVAHVLELDLRAMGIQDYGEISRRGFAEASQLSKVPPLQLFLDSEPQQLARWPNKGTVQMGDILDPGPLNIPAAKEDLPPRPNLIQAERNAAYARLVSHLTDGATEGPIPAPDYAWQMGSSELPKRGGTFTYDYDRPSQWGNAEDIWVAGVFGFSWEWSYNRVAAIDPAARTITLAHGEMSGITKNWFQDFHHFENLLEEIDSPGEYYVDRNTGKIYFYPPADWNQSKDITISTAAFPLVRLRNVSYVTIRGFDLGPGRSDGLVVDSGESVHLEKLAVRSVAGHGITINGGLHHRVLDSHVHHIGKAGVSLGGGDWTTLAPSGHEVRGNNIHDVAFFDRVFNGAVNFRPGSVGHVITNNRIYNTPHVAIIVYGNDHMIEYNNISHSGQISDMGAIYFNLGETPSHRGTIVRRNFFHDIGLEADHVFAVYPDNQTMGLKIEENIFLNMHNAIQVNSGAWITVRNNLFVDVAIPYCLTYHAQGAFDFSAQWKKHFDEHDFARMPHGTRYPELLQFWSEDRQYPETNIFEGNVLFNPGRPLKFADGIEHPKPELLRREGTVVLSDDNGAVQIVGGSLRITNPKAFRSLAGGFPVEVAEHFGLVQQP